eukprot:CAMPEP_0172324640 /NCGR_PEP_ID=MMETSP1058-20130122/51869_1 /TAXON_ID=83371 /ORGANISM="Detonula confervacea, Strain CCMP 353" /LENGTH=458 /DNA_ID=CAMNT_0013040971 /DNA_START=454 /DNA_END=1830 /DNA_ORIENTATION=+
MNSDTAWPAVGNPPPPMDEDPNPEWEMIAEEENTASCSGDNHGNVVIFPGASATETVRLSNSGNNGMIKGRPRSATMGGPIIGEKEAATPAHDVVTMPRNNSSCEIELPKSSSQRRTPLRRCASTPDLMMSDNAHEVIVEDESDDEEVSSEDAELVEAEEDSDGESFEVLSSGKHHEAITEGGHQGDEEPVMIMDEDNDYTAAGGEEESATLVSTPSIGTSSWTMASAATTTTSTSVWGMTKSPSFADILSKNIDENSGVFGKDKVHTEAKLRDSHRRHHLRVRTKPKFIVSKDSDSSSKKTMMKHAHSTGDLTKMLNAVEEGHECSLGQGNRNRRVKKQLSAMMEEDDEEGDFVIGRGSGNSGGCNGGGGGGGGDVFGDTDAIDYYQRKEHGSKSASNKKKERPDEAKRREIIMHKKEMQRKKQLESQNGGGNTTEGGGKKKKKNDKGFGGKKERRR